jgi:hypothetical protein
MLDICHICREARRQAEEKAAAERAALKRQRQQLEALPKLASEIQEEEQIREAKRLRRQVRDLNAVSDRSF